jgi:glucokinase
VTSAETSTFVVAVDLGGTKIAVAPVDAAGECGEVEVRPTPAQDGPERILDAVAAAVSDVIERCENAVVEGVGVGAAGIIDSTTGTVLSATDALKDWPGTVVGEGLGSRLRLPVFIDNDANAHGAGEAWRGAGRGADTVLMVAAGTGVGGAVIMGGRPLHGAHHVAGEIGHAPVRGAEHLRCGCGRSGHLEAVASGSGLWRNYRARGGDPSVANARQVVALARDGDGLAHEVVEEAGSGLGRAMAAVVTVLDPDVVVVGGGLAEAGPLWWEPMERAFREELVDVLTDVPLRPAELGVHAALVGAAHLAWTRLPSAAQDVA